VSTGAPARSAAPVADASRPVPAAPAVRRLARELNVDLRAIRGSGPGGRVLETDVKAFAEGGQTAAPSAPARSAPARPDAAPMTELPPVDTSLPDFSKWGPIRREAVPQIRKTIARQMTRAWLSVPRVTHSDTADVTDLDALRRSLSAEMEKRGGAKLTLTGVLVKALGVALRKYPMLNASFDAATNEIIYKDYVHMGIAVDTPRGLVVPVIRDVDTKTLAQISTDLADVGQRAREVKFSVDDLRGGTFTLSNVGALGGAFVTPMVNFPESAILGVGRTAWQAVVHNDEIAKRFIMPLSLSFDHRIIDGADAARFTREVIGYLENPLRLLSEL
jgi:pyruvate dehydrogenase E2 component (dihydrolipoamide acetyltransferase)